MAKPARIKRYKQPPGPQKISPRGPRPGPVRYRQPDPPVQKFWTEGPRHYRQPVPEHSIQVEYVSPALDPSELRLIDELRGSVVIEHLTIPPIAVLVPVLARPHRVRQLVESFRSATQAADAALYFVAQASDVQEVAAIRAEGLEPILVGDEDRSWARKINRGFERTSESWMLLGADDLRFHAGWVGAVRKLLLVHEGVIGTNDLGNPSTVRGISSTHSLVRRRYAEICGTVDERRRVLHEGYDHNFADNELVKTAKRRGLYVHCFHCRVEHMHPAWGKGQWDAVYTLGNKTYNQDSALFADRGRRFGWRP